MNKYKDCNYFTAGELANLFNISKQSLLYYDKVHLLSPDFISENGYRHYSIKQFLDLEIIVNMRKLNISIANIKNYLHNRNKENFLTILQDRKAECEAVIKKNQQICKNITIIINNINDSNHAVHNKFSLTYYDERLLKITTLQPQDDGKCRISKFARHSQKSSHNNMLLNHTGWIINQKDFFQNHNFYCSSAFFTCHSNIGTHKQYANLILPAGLYLEIIFYGTFYKNGPDLVEKINNFLALNNLKAEGDVYILPLENHWFFEDCDKYINKLFLHTESIN